MEARAVLQQSLAIIEQPGRNPIGLWPRAAALLGRQAIELTLLEVWDQFGVDLGACSFRAQLICLGEALRDPLLAQEVNHSWYALTRACHHQTYELSPTEGELRNWLRAVERFVDFVEAEGAG